MKPRSNSAAGGLLVFFLTIVLCLGFTGLGVICFNKNLPRYLQFPPRDIYITHGDFSLGIFLIYFFVVLLSLALFLYLNYGIELKISMIPKYRFPLWGYLGLVLMLLGWIAAWNRFAVLAPLQLHTYIPLWFGFILFLNAFLKSISGSCPLSDKPVYYLFLFAASAIFWWFYEFLNRAVQNWHYLNTEHFTFLEYVVFASISFATVLPAVEAVFGILNCSLSASAFSRRLTVPIVNSLTGVVVLLTMSLAFLFFLPANPDLLFSALWLSPLIVILCLQKLLNRSTLLDCFAEGRWREPVLWGLAALICGFFWEMWNYYSLAKWVYMIPYVQKFHIFEMPVLGYAGYLPFGLFCQAVTGELRNILPVNEERS